MSYRFDDRPPKPEDHLPKFDVRHGAIMRLAFGVYYTKLHNRWFHRHKGWPSPDHPDRICQVGWPYSYVSGTRGKYAFLNDPIDLIEEGYTKARVKFEDPNASDYLTAQAWIDTETPNIVRMSVKSNGEVFSDKPKDFRFTLFISNPGDTAVDAVCHGMITVLPGRSFFD